MLEETNRKLGLKQKSQAQRIREQNELKAKQAERSAAFANLALNMQLQGRMAALKDVEQLRRKLSDVSMENRKIALQNKTFKESQEKRSSFVSRLYRSNEKKVEVLQADVQKLRKQSGQKQKRALQTQGQNAGLKRTVEQLRAKLQQTPEPVELKQENQKLMTFLRRINQQNVNLSRRNSELQRAFRSRSRSVRSSRSPSPPIRSPRPTRASLSPRSSRSSRSASFPGDRCPCKNKSDGMRCKKTIIEGSEYCAVHSKKPCALFSRRRVESGW